MTKRMTALDHARVDMAIAAYMSGDKELHDGIWAWTDEMVEVVVSERAKEVRHANIKWHAEQLVKELIAEFGPLEQR